MHDIKLHVHALLMLVKFISKRREVKGEGKEGKEGRRRRKGEGKKSTGKEDDRERREGKRRRETVKTGEPKGKAQGYKPRRQAGETFEHT